MNELTSAIQMEMDGEQYYLNQAERNKGTSLHRAFLFLADAEAKHADLLRNKGIQSDHPMNDDLPNTDPASLFSAKADYSRDAVVVPGQLEVYAVARDMELKSIDLYRGMLAEAKDGQARQLFQFLVKQERDHYDFFDELINLISRPRDWVEDAEFGLRKEY